jgi:Family of unknown function (DUF5681)
MSEERLLHLGIYLMTTYDVGYRQPPKHSQFKKGVCSNPRGRPKSGAADLREELDRALHAPIPFREGGKLRQASRLEVNIRKLVALALQGDVASAASLLKLRAHAEKTPDTGDMVIRVIGGPGQPPRELPQTPIPEPDDDAD